MLFKEARESFMKIQSFRIRRFKGIDDTGVSLSNINIIVGSNNSGKSSIIQALHFCISLLQSIRLAKKWGNAKPLIATLGPDEIIYSPSQNPYSLGQGGKLVEGENRSILFDFVLTDGNSFSIEVAKGKNNNIQVRIANPDAAIQLSKLDTPFSIFSPGLAGVAKSEAFVSDGVLLRALARGDANIILRNMLLRLWGISENRDAFLHDLSELFEELEFLVNFDLTIDEYIKVSVKKKDSLIPLELCGTGFLQAVQILCYLHRFRPSLIVLDEPDSHLHPNNQRIIATLLSRISEVLDTQIVITTHSRHIVDALSETANFIWVQSGNATPATRADQLDILLDLGALDLKERIGTGEYDVIVLTEDEISKPLSTVLAASGFSLERVLILPYRGVTSVHNVRTMVDHTRRFSSAKLLVHRDRDFLKLDEVEVWKTQIRELQCEPFVTEGVDIESHLIRADYLAVANPELNELEFAELIQDVIQSVKEAAYEHALNGRLDIDYKNGNRNINVGALAREMRQEVDGDPLHQIAGKRLLRGLRERFKAKTHKNLNTSLISDLVRSQDLASIAGRIVPRSTRLVRQKMML
jgi:hypothetical protein